jgi:F-type H+-transporting ATPase subunit b
VVCSGSGATESAKPAEGSGAEKPKPTEQEENNVYRHSKLVQTFADMFHLPVETMAQILEWVNFTIIFFAIAIPLVRIAPRIFRKRSETLRHNLESARKMTEDANARLQAVEAKMATLDDEIEKLRCEVAADSLQDEARIRTSLQEESERIVSAAEQEIEMASAQARRTLRNFAADLAVDQAVKQLVLTPEADQALIAEFVADMSKNGSNQGGQN